MALLSLLTACSTHADFRCCPTACTFVISPLLACVACGRLAALRCSHASVGALQHPAPRHRKPHPRTPTALQSVTPAPSRPPARPPQEHAITSDEALALEALPAAPIVVLGAGWVEGCREFREACE